MDEENNSHFPILIEVVIKFIIAYIKKTFSPICKLVAEDASDLHIGEKMKKVRCNVCRLIKRSALVIWQIVKSILGLGGSIFTCIKFVTIDFVVITFGKAKCKNRCKNCNMNRSGYCVWYGKENYYVVGKCKKAISKLEEIKETL